MSWVIERWLNMVRFLKCSCVVATVLLNKSVFIVSNYDFVREIVGGHIFLCCILVVDA